MADEWMLDAACRGAENPDMWHGPDSRSELGRRINEAARQVCLGCPVMQQCYDYYAALPRNLRLNVVAGGAIWSPTGYPTGGADYDSVKHERIESPGPATPDRVEERRQVLDEALRPYTRRAA